MQNCQTRFLKMTTSCLLFFIFIQHMEAQISESNTFGNNQTFESGVPSTWIVSNGGNIQATTFRKKQGSQSLVWNWTTGSTINVTDASLAANSTSFPAGLKIWMYSEKSTSDSIRFNFYNAQNNLECSFYYRINFKGWRGLWARYIEDMGRLSYSQPLTRMEIVAPSSGSSGNIYFDVVKFEKTIEYIRSPSYQFAYPNVLNELYEVTDEKESYIYEKWFPESSLPIPPNPTQQELTDLALIKTRIDKWFLGDAQYVGNSQYDSRLSGIQKLINSGKNYFTTLPISVTSDGRIMAPGLFATSAEHSPTFSADIAEGMIMSLALDYKLNGNQQSLNNLILLLNYMHDQGWAEGSAIQTLDHEKLGYSAWVCALYLLKNELDQISWENGKTILDRELATLRWLIGFNAIFSPQGKDAEVSVDDWRTTGIFRLFYILMMKKNDATKVQYLKCYDAKMNYNLAQQDGWNDGIKPDFTGYHHRKPYMSAYSNVGVYAGCLITYFLRNTAFDLSQASKSNLKEYLLAYRFCSPMYDLPKGYCGRLSGIEKNVPIIPAYAYLAQSILPSGIDTALAKAFMRLYNSAHAPVSSYIQKSNTRTHVFISPGEIMAMIDVVNQNYTAENTPSGFVYKPYGGMAIFRNNKWFVSVKGSSAYIPDAERNIKNNPYGNYDSYGQMEICNNVSPYPNFNGSGYDYQNGWNWSKVPGTTSMNYTLAELTNPLESYLNSSIFLGGVSYNGKSGLFAMDFDDTGYGTGLKFKKSVFFFGDKQMICLASAISASTPTKTISTLAQHVVSSSNATYSVNGNSVGNNFTFTGSSQPIKILNSLGVGIIVPNGSGIKMERKVQSSVDVFNVASSGDVFTAWMDHSTKDNYEYSVIMDTDNSELNNLTSTPNYQILEKSAKAHVVKYLPDNQIGYAIFDETSIFNFGIVQQVTLPAVIMLSPVASNMYDLNIQNPDFNRPKIHKLSELNTFAELKGPYPPTIIDITLKGSWGLAGTFTNVQLISSTIQSTIIRVTFVKGRAYHMTIQQNTVSCPDLADLSKTISVYPNPSNGVYNFTVSGDISIYDGIGKIILTQHDCNKIDISSYPPGIYTAVLKNKVTSQSFKLMKE